MPPATHREPMAEIRSIEAAHRTEHRELPQRIEQNTQEEPDHASAA